jgi:hypothetical protein
VAVDEVKGCGIIQLGVRVIAAANAMCHALWLTRVLAEVQGSALSTPLLRVNNKSIVLIKNPVLHGQSKHIEVNII